MLKKAADPDRQQSARLYPPVAASASPRGSPPGNRAVWCCRIDFVQLAVIARSKATKQSSSALRCEKKMDCRACFAGSQ